MLYNTTTHTHTHHYPVVQWLQTMNTKIKAMKVQLECSCSLDSTKIMYIA